MSDVYFEAMEYHSLERKAKIESHADGYNRWLDENTDTFEYIQKLIDQGLPLGKEELAFLSRHAAENIYQKAETAVEDFFVHHFDRVDKQRKAEQESARKNRVISDYESTLKLIREAHVPMWGAKEQLVNVKKDARDALIRGKKYV